MTAEVPSPCSIRPLRAADIAAALDLCRDAGWNQLHDDWQRLISYEPTGCFAAEIRGRLVGTVTTTTYGPELGWIGMMLVHTASRRRGIATDLMHRAVDYLRGRGVQCIKLDATPAGAPVYRRLGFEPEWSFHRWCRPEVSSVDATSSAMNSDLSDTVIQVDRSAFGADRSNYLKRLARDSRVWAAGDGYGMLRDGAINSYLGPICASTPTTAQCIARQLCVLTQSAIFWDVPSLNGDAVDLARKLGFKPLRDLTRMRLGSMCVEPQLQWQYALADPGTG